MLRVTPAPPRENSSNIRSRLTLYLNITSKNFFSLIAIGEMGEKCDKNIPITGEEIKKKCDVNQVHCIIVKSEQANGASRGICW